MNLTHRLRVQARIRPDAPAVVCGAAIDGVAENRVYTYGELDRVVDAIAMRAATWGAGPGEHVAILVRAHLPLLLLRLGLARAGVPFAGATFDGDPSIRVQLPEAGASPDGRTLTAAPGWWSLASGSEAPMAPGGEALLKRQATSGTTGTAKLVPVTHAMYAARWGRTIGLPLPDDVRLLCVSGPGGLGFGYALSVFEAGGTVVLLGPDDDALTLVERHRVNVLVLSPYAIGQTLARRPTGAKPPSLEHVVLSGSRLTRELLRSASERVCDRIVCMYGSTEIGPIAAGAAAAMPDTDGATGFLLADIDVQAIDERGAVLPPGRVGRLRMRGPGMAREYWRDPEATARQFVAGWFYPNDVGAVTQDRTLVIQGRADDLINVGGSKFAPETFEEVLLRVPGVVDAAVFGVPDALGKHRVHAAVVTSGEIDLAAIEAAFRSAHGLPAPAVVLRVPGLPRTAQGKLNRAALVHYVRTVVDPGARRGS